MFPSVCGTSYWITFPYDEKLFHVVTPVLIYTLGILINAPLRNEFRGHFFNGLNGLGLHTGFAVVGAILVHIYSVYQTQQTNQTIADSTVVFSLRLVQWLAWHFSQKV